MDMKRTLLVALAKKSIYPDDPEKREDILTRYAKYIIPVSLCVCFIESYFKVNGYTIKGSNYVIFILPTFSIGVNS